MPQTVPPAPNAPTGPAMRSDKIAMALSTFTRMGTGIIVFVLMARYLGPDAFGLIASAMATAALLGLIADYGLATYALREAGAHPPTATELVRRALLVKLMATALVSLLGLAGLVALHPTAQVVAIAVAVFAAQMLASFADLAFVVVRARRRFDIETRIVVVTSLVSLVVVGGVAALTRDVTACAMAFLATRILYFAATLFGLRSFLLGPDPWPTQRAGLLDMVRRAASLALDGVLTNLSNQIDVVMVGLLLGTASVGIYQAGARLVQSIAPFAVILSSVYLPRLSAALRRGATAEATTLARRLNLEFLALATLGFFGFAVLGPVWTRVVYGPAFAPLIALWPGLACFVLFRFVTSSYGIQLVALAEIPTRIGAQSAAIVTVVAGSALFLPIYGVAAAPWVLAASSLLPMLAYGVVVARRIGNARIVAASLTWSLGLAALALVFACGLISW